MYINSIKNHIFLIPEGPKATTFYRHHQQSTCIGAKRNGRTRSFLHSFFHMFSMEHSILCIIYIYISKNIEVYIFDIYKKIFSKQPNPLDFLFSKYWYNCFCPLLNVIYMNLLIYLTFIIFNFIQFSTSEWIFRRWKIILIWNVLE